MTCQEVSTAARMALPIVYYILDNKGYLIEKLIHAAPPDNDYNAVQPWDYAEFCRSITCGGLGVCTTVATEDELANALDALDAPDMVSKPHVIVVSLDPDDASPALKQLGVEFRKKNRLE